MEQYSPIDYRLIDSGPRPPPRFMRPTMALSRQEQPRPLVPDVSLIFNSPSQSTKFMNSSIAAALASSMNTTPTPLMKNNMGSYVNGSGSPDQRIYSVTPENNPSPSSDPRRPPVLQNHSHNLNNSDPKINVFSNSNSPHGFSPSYIPESQSRPNSAPQVQNTLSPISAASTSNRDSGVKMSLSANSCSPQTEGISMKLLQELMDMMKRQNTTIERMDQQLQTLVEAQHRLDNSSRKSVVDCCIQTEPEPKAIEASAPTATATTSRKQKPDTRKKNQRGSESDTSSCSSPSCGKNSPQPCSSRKSSGPCHGCMSEPVPNANAKKDYMLAQTKPKASTADESIQENTEIEDLSTILRELQLPTIQEQSIYSADNSIRYMDFGNNDNSKSGSPGFDSASLYCTSTEDEDEDSENIVKPTATFYRNVIGNVNRLLDNETSPAQVPGTRTRHHRKKSHNHPPPTDTTLYGMTSNNLSFATRQYLQRHGLVNPQYEQREAEPPQPQPRHAQRFFPNLCHPYQPEPHHNNANDRILDLTQLRNQPKLV